MSENNSLLTQLQLFITFL